MESSWGRRRIMSSTTTHSGGYNNISFIVVMTKCVCFSVIFVREFKQLFYYDIYSSLVVEESSREVWLLVFGGWNTVYQYSILHSRGAPRWWCPRDVGWSWDAAMIHRHHHRRNKAIIISYFLLPGRGAKMSVLVLKKLPWWRTSLSPHGNQMNEEFDEKMMTHCRHSAIIILYTTKLCGENNRILITSPNTTNNPPTLTTTTTTTENFPTIILVVIPERRTQNDF